MIYYYPIILESTESQWSIWLEINHSGIDTESEKLNLHIALMTGTFNPLKDKDGFYSGMEEGFKQVIFRCPVDRMSFSEMVDDALQKLNQRCTSKNVMSFNFESDLSEDENLGVQIKIGGSKETCTLQLAYEKGAIHSKIQTRTSHGRLEAFFGEVKSKLEYLSQV